MSSATVLFVIKHILDLPAADDGGDSTGDRAGAPGANGSARWPSARA